MTAQCLRPLSLWRICFRFLLIGNTPTQILVHNQPLFETQSKSLVLMLLVIHLLRCTHEWVLDCTKPNSRENVALQAVSASPQPLNDTNMLNETPYGLTNTMSLHLNAYLFH